MGSGKVWRASFAVRVQCWPLLALGAMNMTAMLAVAAVISMEKLLPRPEWVVKISGIVAVGLGVLKIAPAFF